jgi:hypothetical protein
MAATHPERRKYDQMILWLAQRAGAVTTHQVMAYCGIRGTNARYVLRKLRDERKLDWDRLDPDKGRASVVVMVPRSARGYWTEYHLAHAEAIVFAKESGYDWREDGSGSPRYVIRNREIPVILADPHDFTASEALEQIAATPRGVAVYAHPDADFAEQVRRLAGERGQKVIVLPSFRDRRVRR